MAVTLVALFFLGISLSDLGFWVLTVWVSSSFTEVWALQRDFYRRLIIEQNRGYCSTFFEALGFEWLGWFCRAKARVWRGRVYWVLSPLLPWLLISHFLIHVCVTSVKTWNQFHRCYWLPTLFSFFDYTFLLFYNYDYWRYRNDFDVLANH